MDILKTQMPENDANAETVGDYLKKLLLKLWSEREGFSGKRPFGNSGWHYELYIAIANAGLIDAEFEDGDLIDFDRKSADEIIEKAIAEAFKWQAA